MMAFQRLALVSLTQASTVPVLPSARLAELATVTLSLTPSRFTPFPNFPAVQAVPLVSVPLLELPEISAVVVPLPSLRPSAITRPEATPPVTVTETGALVVWLPAASRARAESVCEPLVAAEASHEMEYGAVVSSVPSAFPSSRNCTPATPMLSLASADTVTVPVTDAPPAGAGMENTAAGVSGGTLVPFTTALVARFPAASRARADKVCGPAVAPPAFQVMAYGAVVSSAPRGLPSSRNCTPATLTLSLALAETVT